MNARTAMFWGSAIAFIVTFGVSVLLGWQDPDPPTGLQLGECKSTYCQDYLMKDGSVHGWCSGPVTDCEGSCRWCVGSTKVMMCVYNPEMPVTDCFVSLLGGPTNCGQMYSQPCIPMTHQCNCPFPPNLAVEPEDCMIKQCSVGR